MIVIIAGSRGLNDFSLITDAVKKSGYEISEVVSGTANGVDRMGEKFATMNKIPLKKFPADWSTHGKSAGYKRNFDMALYADALIAIWDGNSRGTMHMINIMRKEGKPVYVSGEFNK